MKTKSVILDKGLIVERVERRILLIRGHKVMLDSDLAELYGVPTFRLNEQINTSHAKPFVLILSKVEGSKHEMPLHPSTGSG